MEGGTINLDFVEKHFLEEWLTLVDRSRFMLRESRGRRPLDAFAWAYLREALDARRPFVTAIRAIRAIRRSRQEANRYDYVL